MDEIFKSLINYGVLGVIAWVFFKDYFESKKHHQALSEKQIEHENGFTLVVDNNTKAIQSNNETLKYTKSIHDQMDVKLNTAITSIDELKKDVREGRMQDRDTTGKVLVELEVVKKQLLAIRKDKTHGL